jgi:hypothetical protein
LVEKELTKRNFFNRQRPKFLLRIEARDDIDGDVEPNLRRWEAILCGWLGAYILDGCGWSSGGMWQRHSYWLKGGGGGEGEANLGATVAHPEGADRREGVVEVVL